MGAKKQTYEANCSWCEKLFIRTLSKKTDDRIKKPGEKLDPIIHKQFIEGIRNHHGSKTQNHYNARNRVKSGVINNLRF